MTGQCRDFPASIQIICQCRRDFRRKIQHDLIAAFSCHQKSIVFQIHIGNIQSDALRNAYARTQKQRNQRKITLGCQLLVCFLTLRQPSTCCRLLQHPDHFFLRKPDNRLFVDFGKRHQRRHIGADSLILE